MKKIYCPYCQAEYLPNEIFIPEYFFGTAKDIEKDANGKIVDFTGKKMDLDETYRCDFCNQKFNISCDLKFNTDGKTVKKNYKTKLSKPSLFMSED